MTSAGYLQILEAAAAAALRSWLGSPGLDSPPPAANQSGEQGLQQRQQGGDLAVSEAEGMDYAVEAAAKALRSLPASRLQLHNSVVGYLR